MQELMLFQRPKRTRASMRHSAQTFGASILTWVVRGEGKWALWQFCPTTEESLKMQCRVYSTLRQTTPL
jgi:hypothetical protein